MADQGLLTCQRQTVYEVGNVDLRGDVGARLKLAWVNAHLL